MQTLRIHVTPYEGAFVANAAEAGFRAEGKTPESAAENVRLLALRKLDKSVAPTILIIRVDEPGRNLFAMQPSNRPVSLDGTVADGDWAYYASVNREALQAS